MFELFIIIAVAKLLIRQLLMVILVELMILNAEPVPSPVIVKPLQFTVMFATLKNPKQSRDAVTLLFIDVELVKLAHRWTTMKESRE